MSLRTPLALLIALVCGCASNTPPPASELEKVIVLEEELAKGEDFEVRTALSSACIGIVEHPLTSSADKLSYAKQALAHADKAIDLDAKRVEGHYYRAVSIGHVLDNQLLPQLGMIGDLEAAGLAAKKIDPAFKCAGPLRLLALLYQKAPAWPIGPEDAGEVDVIEGLFEEAIRLRPECVQNHVAYAEFLEEEDRDLEARKATRRARKLLATAELPALDREDLARRVTQLEAALTP